ncbi:flagellar biosynthetic protein FliO [Chungangia koreensis]|uniref:Flagellar biosynthetic protein FliO n=1 Tax=Chungangia koreensis TaxID=752657 RepID=A0ABV8X575_9LACT
MVNRLITLVSVMLLLLVLQPVQLVSASPNAPVSDWYKQPDPNSDGSDRTDSGNDRPDSPAEDEQSDSGTVSLSLWDYLKMLFALLFVVGLLYGLLRFVNKRNLQYQKNRLIQNHGGINLGQHKSVQVLEIGSSFYLVGVGEDITLLKEITDPAEIEKFQKNFEERESTAPLPFIAEVWESLKGKSGQLKSTDSESKFQDVFQQRLKELKDSRKKGIEDWKKGDQD